MVTAADRNTHGGESSSIALRDHLKMASKDVKQSIKNRYQLPINLPFTVLTNCQLAKLRAVVLKPC